MPAYKPRKPGSFAHATTELRDLFGVGPMGLRVGISDGAINAACDADQSNYCPLRIDRALDLDVWFVKATGRAAPLYAAYGQMLADRTQQAPMAGLPHENMANLSKESAEVIEAIAKFVASEGCSSASEEVVRQCDDVIRLMQAIRTKHARNAGLGPSSETTNQGEAA